MRHAFIDRYSRMSSPVHRASIPVKVTVLVGVLVSTVMVPISVPLFFLPVAGFLIAIALISRIPLLFLVSRLLFLEVFVIGIGILSLLQPNGVATFAAVFAKSTLCLFTVVLFSNTTPFADLLRALRRAGFPDLMITVLALMYHYIFVLIDEMERMQRARVSRTFVTTRRFGWESLATVVGQLFIRSTERAERIYAAMCARGWK